MRARVYSIFDRVAEEFGPPALCKNDAVAVRMARNALKEGRLDDFRLYYIGEFDDVKGMLYGEERGPVEVSMLAPKED